MTRIEVLSIGDELLDGRVTDTNTVRLALALSDVGEHLSHRATVIDDLDAIIEAARAAVTRGTSLCVVSGGLGPTSDDLTAAAFAKLMGVELVRDAAQVARIEAMLARRGRAISDNQLKQADRPKGAEVLVNETGTAPGFAVTYQGCRFVSMPGIPREFDHLVEKSVVGPLRSKASPVLRRGLYCFGIIEAEADKRVAALHSRWPQVRLQFRVKFPEIHVTMHAVPEMAHALDEAYSFALEQLGAHVFATRESESFPATVLKLLQARGATLGVAESCTGGLVTDMLTDVPGSSAALLGGVVCYANAVKQSILGVREDTLAAHGAVSEAAIFEMAEGIRSQAGSTYGVATSGIAGPGGGTAEKPVGTVWLGLVGPNCRRSHKLSLPFERRNNKVVSAYSALDLLRREMLAPGAP